MQREGCLVYSNKPKLSHLCSFKSLVWHLLDFVSFLDLLLQMWMITLNMDKYSHTEPAAQVSDSFLPLALYDVTESGPVVKIFC